MGNNGSNKQAWTRLLAAAAENHGVVTTAMALDAGVPRSTFHRRMREERWRQLAPTAWLAPAAPITWQARLTAAILTLGPTVATSHDTALALHGLACESTPQRPLHVLVPHEVTGTAPHRVVRHRSKHFEPDDIRHLRGWPITSPARAVVDVAGWRTSSGLEGLLLQARQRRLLTFEAVASEIARRPTVAGTRQLREALRVLDGHDVDSLLELRVRRMLTAAGLEPAAGPYRVRVPNGALFVDVAFPEWRVGIECDGHAYHSSRPAFERDRHRWGLLRDAGWLIVWATWARVHDQPAELVAEVRRTLARAPTRSQDGPVTAATGTGTHRPNRHQP